MIKVKVNNEYKDVVKIFCGGTLQKEITKVWSREAQEYVYESSVEYTGSLPITINANGDALIDYRIYGTDGGLGVATKNLYNWRTDTQYKFISRSGIVYSGGSSDNKVSDKIPVVGGKTYLLVNPITVSGSGLYAGFYNANNVMLNSVSLSLNTTNYTLEAPPEATYFRTSLKYKSAENDVTMFIEGATPTSYEPHGYKLPMVIYDQNLLADNISQFGNGYININGSVKPQDPTKKEKYSDYISIAPNTSYTFAMTNGFPGDPSGSIDTKPWRTIAFYRQNKTFISRMPAETDDAVKPIPFTVTSPSNASFVHVTWRSYGSEECPVLVTNRDIYPVYIGDTPLDAIGEWSDYVDYTSGKIVRKIAEYTFTGDESFNKYGNSDVFYTSKTIDPVGITTVNTTTMRCDHPAFTAIENKDTRYWLNPEADNICCFLPGGMSQVFLRSTSNFTTATECKAYLKAQYDNGTPVKISYWLKTPVEEDPPVPLPEIPTIDGTTVIDYDGDPKPSQMYVKYRR